MTNLIISKINKTIYFTKKKKFSLLQLFDKKLIDVPRFCFHEKLSIAGNCRLCLIEIENFLKPIASCAYPLANNMVIYTDTLLVKKAREGILEFLLINHPLDCPICDWGGECDLQDQVFLFGGDRGRFYETKRAVEPKKISPMIKMLMTRCIHCTRCVRFLIEIAGEFSLGVVGRGRNMEISTFVQKNLKSVVAGNIIDLCPVGALTSKPYSFRNRPWKLFSKINTIDIFDTFGSNICLEVLNNEIMRVLPKYNKFLNEEWITDKVRFFYDAFKIQRLGYPFLFDEVKKKYIYVSWEFAFLFLKRKFKFYKDKFGGFNICGILGPYLDVESLAFFKYFLNQLGSSTFLFDDQNLLSTNKINVDFRESFFFNFDFFENNYDSFLLLGVNLYNESPILQLKFRKLLIQNSNSIIFSFGSNVKSILNSVLFLGVNPLLFFKFIEGNSWVSSYIVRSKTICLIVGSSVISRYDFNSFKLSLDFLKLTFKNFFKVNKLFVNYLLNTVTSIHSAELGLIKNFLYNILLKKNIFYCLNIDNSKYLKKNINIFSKKNFLIYQGAWGDSLVNNKFNIILPSYAYVETDCFFLNCFGMLQKTNKALNPFMLSKKNTNIFCVLSFFLDKNFKYLSKFSLYSKLIELSPIFIKNKNIKVTNLDYLNLKFKFTTFNNSVLSVNTVNFFDVNSILVKNSNNMVMSYFSIESKQNFTLI